ncbi:hypothetical protein BDV93DRAFT_544036 [Ceratobasidium sp. AG-I]|nr:hypothetical protein BDV93DRAFT_544036 [Ceratobasidium sp. AG-I]
MSESTSTFLPHALFIPEIASLVCDWAERSDWVSLLRTCRSIFPIVASRVWENIDDSSMVFALISDKSSDTQPARFNIYTPFIRRLSIDCRTILSLQTNVAQFLEQRARQGALLPNLVSLTADFFDSHPETDQVATITKFISPSLQELKIAPGFKSERSRLSVHMTSAVLKTITNTCQHIEVIEIHPAGDSSSAGDRINSSIISLKDVLHQGLHSITALRYLSGSISLIDNGGLEILGALPHLESLSIIANGECPNDLDLCLPTNTFPVLTRLSLLKLDVTSLTGLMGLKHLVENLVSLSLSQAFSADWSYGARQSWLSNELPTLLEHTSHLQQFNYDARESTRMYNIHDTQLLEAMSALPLQSVNLSGLSINTINLLRGVATAWPRVTKLRMPDQLVRLDKIAQFSDMPNLQTLSIGILFSDTPASWPTPNTKFHTLEDTSAASLLYGDVDVAKAARFLVSAWPNLQRIAWAARTATLSARTEKRYFGLNKSLNEEIRLARGVEVVLL